MPDVIGVLERSADLVSRWGGHVLADGQTVAAHLTYDGLSLWEVVNVDLAVYLVPEALSAARPHSWYQKVRRRLGHVRSRLRNAPPRRPNASGCANWPDGSTAVLLGFSDYVDRDVLVPVAERLMPLDFPRPLRLYDGRQSVRAAEPDGRGDSQSIWDHWSDPVRDDYRRMRAWFRRCRTTLVQLGFPDVIHDPKRPLEGDVRPVFDFLFRRHLPTLLGHVAVARHLIEHHRPALVVSPDVADPRTRIYSLLALKHAIPTLNVVFGDIFGSECTEWRFFRGDRIAASGEKTRDAVAAQGVNRNLISVTGSPRHDQIVQVSVTETARLRADLGVTPGETMALFASTVSLNAYDGLRDRQTLVTAKATILAAAESVAGMRTIVKPHPLEDVKETQALAAGASRLTFVDRRLDIRRLTTACDIFITLGSSATLGALIARKLVVYPVFENLVYWDDQFLASGAVQVVRSARELEDVLRTAVGGGLAALLDRLEPARENFLRAWAFRPDGQASARVAALARQMVVERSATPAADGAVRLAVPR